MYCLTVPTRAGSGAKRRGARADTSHHLSVAPNFGLPGRAWSIIVRRLRQGQLGPKPIILSVQEAADLKRHWLTIYPKSRRTSGWHNNLLMMGGVRLP